MNEEMDGIRRGFVDWGWVTVPIVAFGAIALDILLFSAGILGPSLAGEIGKWGCVASTILLAGIAILKPRKDIVALVTPIYALIIFILPNDFSTGLLMQLLFAGSIAILAIRLQRSFSSPPEKRRVFTDYPEEDDIDEDRGVSE